MNYIMLIEGGTKKKGGKRKERKKDENAAMTKISKIVSQTDE